MAELHLALGRGFDLRRRAILTRLGPGLRLGLGLGLLSAVGLLLGAASPARAATLLWDQLGGGSFDDPGHWALVPGPGSGVPGPFDDAVIDVGTGSAPLGGPIVLGSDASIRQLNVFSGQSEIDLSGLTLELGTTLQVVPLEAGDQPTLQISSSAPDGAFDGLVEVANGGRLTFLGPDVQVAAPALSIGPIATSFPDTGTASILRFDGGAQALVDEAVTVGVTGNPAELQVSGLGSRVEVSDAFLGAIDRSGPEPIFGGNINLGENALLQVDLQGVVDAPVIRANDGDVVVETGGVITTGQLWMEDGDLSISGGSSLVSVTEFVSIQENGTLSMSGGVLQAQTLTVDNPTAGSFAFSGGTIEVEDLRVASDFIMGSSSQTPEMTITGIAEFEGELLIGTNGSLVHRGDVVIAKEGISNPTNGVLDWQRGELRVLAGGFVVGEDGPLADNNLVLQPSEYELVEVGETLEDLVIVETPHPRKLLVKNGDLTIDGAGFYGASITVEPGGELRADRIALVNGGSLTYNGGLLQLFGTEEGDGLTVGASGLLGDTVGVADGDEIRVARDVLVEAAATLALSGGKFSAGSLDLEGDATRLDFQTGQLSITASDLVVGTGLGIGDDITVAADQWLSLSQALDVTDGLVTVDGGNLAAAEILVGGETGLEGGRVNFDTGVLNVAGDLRISATDGITATDGGIDVVADSRFYADTVTIADGETLTLDGGLLNVDDIETEGTGSFDFLSGRLQVQGDLFVGSSYVDPEGLHLANNTTDPSDPYYRIDSGMDVWVRNRTHVDSSGLAVASGGSLSTLDLTGGNFIVDEGGSVTVRRVAFSGGGYSSVSGDVTGEQIDIEEIVFLSASGRLIGDSILAANGTLTGNGNVIGDLVNGGRLEPGASPGTLGVDGAYTQLSSGVLEIELGKTLSTGEIVGDVLSVSGVAEIEGTLEVLLATATTGLDPAFDPAADDPVWTFLTAKKVLGTFDSVLGRDLGNGSFWQLIYTNTSVFLGVTQSFTGDLDLRTSAAVPEAGTGLLVGLGLVGLAARRRRSAR